MHTLSLLLTRLAAFVLGGALAGTALAAPLPDTPATLKERSRLVRDSRDRPWDPATGQLGNLSHVNLLADGCTVRIVSGPDNRLLGPRDRVQVMDDTHGRNNMPAPIPRDITLTTHAERGALPRGTVCLTLQLATADDLVIRGSDTAILFDHVELPALRIYLNPSWPLRVWFQDVRIGHLTISSNAGALVGGTGQAQWLTLDTSQASTAMFFHDMDARHIGVSTTTTRPRFSIRIGAGTEAGYYQPARAPGDIARLYPIWIDGPVDTLQVPAGHVDPMALTPAIRNEARALRDEVLARAGTAPERDVPPRTSASIASPAPALPTTPGQQVANGFEAYLPNGVTVASVQLWNKGGALEGTAPDEAAVRALVQSLGRSPDVVGVQTGYTRPQGAQVFYRVVFILACDAPGAATVCLGGNGGPYTAEQIRGELLPIIGAAVTLTKLELRGNKVLLEGLGSDADINAALERIRKQARWIRGHSSQVGHGSFSAWMEMACGAPPPARGGICQATTAGKR
jgi:hypothetical protein